MALKVLGFLREFGGYASWRRRAFEITLKVLGFLRECFTAKGFMRPTDQG